MTIALYFGCLDTGHYLWSIADGRYTHEWKCVTPWPKIDGELQPGCGSAPIWKLTQEQSAGQLHHRDGWTAIAFWDRTGDERGNSNSTFLFDATLTFTEALEQARIHFPEIVARMEAAAPLHEVSA